MFIFTIESEIICLMFIQGKDQLKIGYIDRRFLFLKFILNLISIKFGFQTQDFRLYTVNNLGLKAADLFPSHSVQRRIWT